MGFWDRVKKAFGGGKPPDEPPETPDLPVAPTKPAAATTAPSSAATGAATAAAKPKELPSGRSWSLTKRGKQLVLEAPHGVFAIRGIADSARAAFEALPEGAECACEGNYVGGGKTITDLVVTAIAQRTQKRPPAPQAPTRPQPQAQPQPTARANVPRPPPPDPAARWRADEILGLSPDELRERALNIPAVGDAVDRARRYDPAPDGRTHGDHRSRLDPARLLTEAQITEIDRIGDQWLAHHDAFRLAQIAAQGSGERALAELKARRARDKAARKVAAAEREAARVAEVAKRRATDIIYAGRGVSARLGDWRAHVEELTRLGLPVLASPADLARALELAIPKLRWLCFHNEAAAKTHYVYFEVPKRSGGVRLLAAPHAQLATAQRWIPRAHPGQARGHALRARLRRAALDGDERARARRQGSRRHARPENFFPTITFPRVRGLFESLGYSPAVATLLALLTTESPRVRVLHDADPLWVAVGERALPQGACTSPTLSNLVARKLHRRLAGASGSSAGRTRATPTTSRSRRAPPRPRRCR